MYELNAIQFGIDQMLESSSEESLHVGPLTIFYILSALLYYKHKFCKIELNVHEQSNTYCGSILLFPSVIQIILNFLGCIL